MILMNYLYSRSFGAHVLNVPPKYRKIIVIRSLVGFFGIEGIWSAVKYMPFSLATCIYYTQPIMAAVMASIFLGEKMAKSDYVAMVFAFIGVIMVTNPF